MKDESLDYGREMNELLAEIHNKITRNSSNLSDRVEDQLTGNFFGSLRYLPFQDGLSKMLYTAQFSNEVVSSKWEEALSRLEAYELEYKFWFRHEKCEIDLLLSSSDILIGIEVKYISGLSSDDEIGTEVLDYRESRNQLLRYTVMLEQIAGNRPVYILFLAPFEMMNAVRKTLLTRYPNVQLGFMNWQDLHQQLSLIGKEKLDIGHQLIVEDLKQLLEKKELVRFRGFVSDISSQQVTSESYQFSEEVIQFNWPSIQIKGDYYEYKR